MAAEKQKGFEYEKSAYSSLKKYHMVDGEPAGASHDKPDLTLRRKNKTSGCELKIAATSAGSLVLKYNNGKWGYGEYKNDIEKEFLHDIFEQYHLMKEMNISGAAGQNWRNKTPCLQNTNVGKKIIIGAKDKRDAYAQDIEKYGAKNEIHINVPAKAIADYYNTKKCSYMNVGSHGFYLLNKDELDLSSTMKLNGHSAIPQFGESANCKIRVRVQYKGGGDYQFVSTLEFFGVKKSPYNIAPLKKNSSSEIDEDNLQKDPILLAFT